MRMEPSQQRKVLMARSLRKAYGFSDSTDNNIVNLAKLSNGSSLMNNKESGSSVQGFSNASNVMRRSLSQKSPVSSTNEHCLPKGIETKVSPFDARNNPETIPEKESSPLDKKRSNDEVQMRLRELESVREFITQDEYNEKKHEILNGVYQC